ncbi:MAG: hypothetical protein ACLVAT_08135 [Lachnospiraceae bacterium]
MVANKGDRPVLGRFSFPLFRSEPMPLFDREAAIWISSGYSIRYFCPL